MAITGAIFNSLVFGNVNSANYGIYITGAGAFNAPERAVELVSIPGRNGAIAIDQGRYENIEVTYPAGVFGDSKADFRTRFAEFRNAMKSQIGYQRLTDTYNPNEYRMALFISAIEIDPVAQNKAGEFNIVFNCKPQRWLTSGETEVTVSSGGTLTNPTLFDSSPLLKVRGYGELDVNGYNITLNDGTVGQIILAENTAAVKSLSFADAPLNAGDAMTYEGTKFTYVSYSGVTTEPITAINNVTSNADSIEVTADGTYITIVATYPTFNTTFGDTSSLQNIHIYFEPTIMESGIEHRMMMEIDVNIMGLASGGVELGNPYIVVDSVTGYPDFPFLPGLIKRTIQFTKVSAFSTLSYTAQTMYIDCDIGEAYMIYNGVLTSLNKYIDLGSKLAVLSPGSNTITYDNTITEFKIVPRWWQL